MTKKSVIFVEYVEPFITCVSATQHQQIMCQ